MIKNNKIIKSLTVALALASYALGSAKAVENTDTQNQVLDSTAAVVNNAIITENELNDMVESIKEKYKNHGANVDQIDIRRQALQALITRSIILQMAANGGMRITDMQLDSTLEQAALRSNTSVEQILKGYGNISTAAAREKFKEDYVINEVRRNSVAQRIHISPSEINSLAKALKSRGGVEPQYHIAQIIIPMSSNPSDNEYIRIQNEARKALKEAKAGVNFDEIAAKYAVNENNSDFGYIPESSVPLPFLPAVVSAKPGDVVGPFRSAVGMHIIKVYDVSHSAARPIKTYDSAHILIKTSIIFSDEAAVAKLKSILDDIKAGKISFEDAAKKYSEDPGSAVNGGNLGYATAQTYDPGFAKGLESLKVGQIGGPFKSSFGWHLIYLKNTKIDRESLDVFKQKAQDLLFDREYQEALLSWERSIRELAYIHILDPILLKAGVSLENDPSLKNQTLEIHDDQNSQELSKDAKFVD